GTIRSPRRPGWRLLYNEDAHGGAPKSGFRDEVQGAWEATAGKLAPRIGALARGQWRVRKAWLNRAVYLSLDTRCRRRLPANRRECGSLDAPGPFTKALRRSK